MSGAGRAQKFPSATSWRIDRSSSFLGQQLLQPGVPLLQLLEALGIHARQSSQPRGSSCPKVIEELRCRGNARDE